MVALSGGSLPKLLGPPLVAEPSRAQVDWSAWYVFWADERCVPLTDTESNYRLAREYLFDHVSVPAEQIYAIDDSLGPGTAAIDYQAKIARVFQPAPGQLPRFDLILLGMGEDGHTASLFPNHPLLNEAERWVAPILDSPKPPPERITLTLPVINNARNIAFMVTGAGKAGILTQALAIDAPSGTVPSHMVKPVRGELHWFVDEAAASGLSG
jgi:6-phosphogluconolactonase